ncbi:hypothetical protein DXG01_015632 [Tephrocybe rancida]|nr:hypothetical protein DXG01_015632 [Tephrocybe rancida]
MSRTQTQTQSRTHAHTTPDESRERRKFEIWHVDQAAREQASKQEAEGQWMRGGRMTTLKDWPPSISREADHDTTRASGPYYKQAPETRAPLQEPEKVRRGGTDRYRTVSSSSRPFNTSNGHTTMGGHARRASMDSNYAQDRDAPLPYDSRHMYHDPTPPPAERRIRSEAERKLAECMKEKKSIAAVLGQTVEKLEASERRNEELGAEVERLAGALEALKGQFHDAEGRRRRTARTLQETAEELHATNLFLTKMDKVSDADVVDVVDNLNAEIMQTSALMADALGGLNTGREKEPEDASSNNERLFNRRALGGAMIEYLEQEGQIIDLMAVQLALQFCIAEACYVVVESWRPGDWRADGILYDIYTSLKRTVHQSVFGRWRAMTRSQTNYAESQGSVYIYLHRRIRDVLSLAGWPSHIPSNQAFLERFKDRIEHIVRLSLKLHRVASEDMTSRELRTRMVYPEEKFDGSVMDEAFPDEMNRGERTGERVSGTTDLGLMRIVGSESRILRKPKVVVLSALHVLLEEP